MSDTVTSAFRAAGHDAYSCDLLPSMHNSPYHWIGNVLEAAYNWQWDMGIFFPPCTFLTVAGARWFAERKIQQQQAIEFVELLYAAPIKKIAIENPIGVLSTKSWIGKPSQIIQPWWFGHGETKATCLWLKNLPPLKATNVVEGRIPRVHYESPQTINGLTRAMRRAIFLPGIAAAMAAQWK